jgi:hypothetical protein
MYIGKIRLPNYEFEEVSDDGSNTQKEVLLDDEIFEDLQDLHVSLLFS